MASEARPAARETAAFLTLLGLAVATLLVLCLRVAGVEWFSSDDFATLNEVQRHSWSWFDTFLPLETRTRWYYRPLGVNSWFYVNFQLFGLNAPPWFAQAVALHFATGFVTLRIARQLGFSLPVAALAAALSVSRFASIDRIYYGSLFSYVAAVFFSAIAVSLLIDHTRSGSSRALAASCLAFVLTLLCHEYAVVYIGIFPFVSFVAQAPPLTLRGFVDALRSCAPYIGITGAYLVTRLFVIADSSVQSPYYHLFGANLVTNYLDYWWMVSEGAAGLLVFVAAAAASLFLLLRWERDREERRQGLAWLASIQLLGFVWVSASVVLFLTQPAVNSRYGLLIEIPACLLLASHLEVVWRALGARHALPVLATFLALGVAAMPWATVAARADAPQRPNPVGFIRLLRGTYPQLQHKSRVVVLYGSPGLASLEEGKAFAQQFYGRTAMLRALVPDKDLKLALHDMELAPSGMVICRSCVYFALLPGLQFELASEETLRALFERGARSSGEGVRKLSTQALEALDRKVGRGTQTGSSGIRGGP